MQHLSPLELEQEISRMAYAIMTRDPRIGKDLLANLRHRVALEHLASIVLASLDQVIQTNTEAFIWAVEHLLPVDVIQSIHRITSFAVGQQLIRKGLLLGKDFSMDATGRLLLNAEAKTIILEY